MDAYIFCADIYCKRCGEDIIRDLIKEGKHPDIDCRGCGYKGPIGKIGALRAFNNRNTAQWLSCPKCKRQGATFTDPDSDSWPQWTDESGGAADSPQHCGKHDLCVNAMWMGDTKCGKFLKNPLTPEGRRYVEEMVETSDGSTFQDELHGVYRRFYGIKRPRTGKEDVRE